MDYPQQPDTFNEGLSDKDVLSQPNIFKQIETLAEKYALLLDRQIQARIHE